MDWKRKLGSRKFWAAVVGVVLSVMVMFDASDDDKNKVAALITACSTLAVYILSEGVVDTANKPAELIELDGIDIENNPDEDFDEDDDSLYE